MARPSQCRACGCFEACLLPASMHCDEYPPTKEKPVSREHNYYQSADGVVWRRHSGARYFLADGKTGRTLEEVLRDHGALSLYDPLEESACILAEAMIEAGVLQVSFSHTGRITDLYHAGATGVASTNIYVNKRAYVLEFLGVSEDAL